MFSNWSITFGNPWWLLAIPILIPPLVLMSIRSLAGLGKFRQALAIVIRAAVISLLILAIAELQTVRRSDKLSTLFLIDLSESIPNDRQAAMLQYINEAARKQKRRDDLAGVIVFGRNARVETPPSPNPPSMLSIENPIDPQYTDLAGAIKLALGSFPEDTARRIVILSDGNENRGSALEQALIAADQKVQIDTLPIEYSYDREVLVERVSVPPDVKQGETVNINVVIRASEPVAGSLQVFQKVGTYLVPLNEKPEPVELERGINVRTLKQTIQEPNFYTFTAQFIPDRGSGDQKEVNNAADAFVYARGAAKVLLIEAARGEHAELVQALREKQIEVDVLVAPRIEAGGETGGDQLPTDIAQLQPYDAVILGNVPKDSFTEQQIAMFEANTHDLGAGLIMLGGPNSFGAGGWMNTPVEKALPVDMQIKAMKVQGKSALVMIMHASEIPEGNYWQKVVSQEALKTLSPYDYAGMLHWEGQEAWLFTLREIGQSKSSMLRAIDRMTPGDMPDADPSIQMAAGALRARTDAMTKHIIIISDGDPTPPTGAVINQLVNNKITVTSVLVAAHGGDTIGPGWMQQIATRTKGRFYNVTNPKALPRIYQKEARLISRPLIFERAEPWALRIDSFTEPILGLQGDLPGISGFVLTELKENELVEVPISSPLPAQQRNPILAHWTYGLGRSVAFTSDAGRKWTKAWPSWSGYAAFWSQVVRWALRPVERGNLSMSLRREDGQIKVVVDALDKDDRFLNSLQFRASVLDPELKRKTFGLVQTGPGRYEGTIDHAEARGSYFVNLGYLTPAGTPGLLSAGVSVPYSDEYRELRSNPALLENLAAVTGGQVLQWKYRRDGTTVDLERTLETGDVFRRDPKLAPPPAFKALWPFLIWLASLLFLGDVAVRRIAPDFERMRHQLKDAWTRLRGREVAPREEYMEKLRGRKAEVATQIEKTRAAARLESLTPASTSTSAPSSAEAEKEPDAASLAAGAAEIAGGETKPQTAPPARPAPKPTLGVEPKKPATPAESYTDRLLKAKQKVWEEREKDKDKPQ
jgi:uncharacterized membrane protein